MPEPSTTNGVVTSPAAAGEVDGAPTLSLRNVAKTFADKTVLNLERLDIRSSEIRALLGQNGSGKSTLIKILSGYHQPDPGAEIRVGGEDLSLGSPRSSHEAGLRFVHQDLGLVGKASVLDNLAYGRGYQTRVGTIRRRVAIRNAEEALERVGLEVDPRLVVAELTPSQQTAVAVARAIDVGTGARPRLLVLDEPTATLPDDEVESLLAMMRRTADSGVAVIFVTHHLDEAFKVSDQISVLRGGRLIGTVPATIDRDALVEMLVGEELERAYRKEAERAGELDSAATPKLVVRRLAADHLKAVSFTVHPGEVLGVYGLTGSGRETLLGATFGALPRVSGKVEVDGRDIPAGNPRAAIQTGVGYLAPDRKTRGGMMQLSARENLTIVNPWTAWSTLGLRRRKERQEALSWFKRVAVSPPDAIDSPLASFSGGNQQKILFAKWLRQSPGLLLMDEPTQGVDVGARAVLHGQILAAAEAGAAVVVSSTDEEELAAICSRIIVLSDGEISSELEKDSITEQAIATSMHSNGSAPAGEGEK